MLPLASPSRQTHVPRLTGRLGLRALGATIQRMVRIMLSSLRAEATRFRPRRCSLKDVETLSLFGGATGFNSLLSSPLANDALLHHLARKRGGENLEFALACWNFDNVCNPLQRFQQLRNIIHRFVRDNAERSVSLSKGQRANVLTEWCRWSDEGRVPAGLRLRALEAAVAQIHKQIAAHDAPAGPGPA
jgi:hypothetical protein